jgi:hypothetical protein
MRRNPREVAYKAEAEDGDDAGDGGAAMGFTLD